MDQHHVGNFTIGRRSPSVQPPRYRCMKVSKMPPILRWLRIKTWSTAFNNIVKFWFTVSVWESLSYVSWVQTDKAIKSLKVRWIENIWKSNRGQCQVFCFWDVFVMFVPNNSMILVPQEEIDTMLQHMEGMALHTGHELDWAQERIEVESLSVTEGDGLVTREMVQATIEAIDGALRKLQDLSTQRSPRNDTGFGDDDGMSPNITPTVLEETPPKTPQVIEALPNTPEPEETLPNTPESEETLPNTPESEETLPNTPESEETQPKSPEPEETQPKTPEPEETQPKTPKPKKRLEPTGKSACSSKRKTKKTSPSKGKKAKAKAACKASAKAACKASAKAACKAKAKAACKGKGKGKGKAKGSDADDAETVSLKKKMHSAARFKFQVQVQIVQFKFNVLCFLFMLSGSFSFAQCSPIFASAS